MSFTRPSSVPPQAQLVYPNGVGTPPGYDPQLAAIDQFEATIAYLNRQAMFNYAGAYRDWNANAQQYAAYGIPNPVPQPLPPPTRTANVVYADQPGNVHQTRQPSDAAWIWES